LIVTGVGRLVAEQQQVEGLGLGPDRTHDRSRGGLRVPLLAAGQQVHGTLDPDRHHVAQLLLGLGRPKGQHRARAAVLLDEADRLLDAALLVGADREAEMPGRDRPLVLGEGDLAAGQRHALYADENVHVAIGSGAGWMSRTRALSGSKSDVESLV